MNRLRLLHRRLAVLMGLAGLLGFAGGIGFEPLSASLAACALFLALFWQPSEELAARMERLWLPVALLLVARALYHVFVVGDDVVIPVVDLLLLLLAAEALRSLEAVNDLRIYALSFALMLASTAYRPGLLFAVAFVAYVGLATVALMVGHLRRASERRGIMDLSVPRRYLASTAALSSVTLAMSALVFFTFPRVSRGWAGRGAPAATSIAGFADEVSLGNHGSRILSNPQIVLRVEFPDDPPASLASTYWRGRSYDRFDGVRWSRSPGLPPSKAPNDWYTERWQGEVVRQEIYSAPLSSKVLFAMHPLVGVISRSRIQPVFDNAGDYVYWGSAAPVYSAYSRSAPPEPEFLTASVSGFTPARAFYVQLPAVTDRVHALADSLTEGAANRLERVERIQRWFHDQFTYTLTLPASAEEATVEHFLFERRAGHCEYFSTAMIVLLRSLGIPSRQVNGFLGGDWNAFGQYLAVSQNRAHSWVEVWFPRVGWVTFDPTPSASQAGSTSRTWAWPGRFLVDGLQHRWNKWVLDYSLDRQADLLARTTALWNGGDGEDASAPEGRSLLGLLIWVAGAIAAAGTGWYLLARERLTLRPESSVYVKLKAAYQRTGMPGLANAPPLAFVDLVRAGGLPGVALTEAVVKRYLRARFGGAPLTPEEHAEMMAAVGRVRLALRREAG